MGTKLLSDAECLDAMRLVERHGSSRKASVADGSLTYNQICGRVKEGERRKLKTVGQQRDPLTAAKVEISDLKRQLRVAQVEADTAAKIRDEIWKLEKHDPAPPEWLMRAGKGGDRGMPVLFASDWHYGEVVRPEEIGGVNEFNSDIAAKRIKRMTETAIDLAFNHMGKAKTVYPGIVLAYGGDMISGDIHEELAQTNDKTPIQCVNDLTDLMGAQVEALATKFGRVHIPCVTGNHGRNSKKMHLKGRVFTSYEWNIYCNLRREFKRNKQITFQIPEQTDARFNVYGHRYLLTHGDMLGVKGGDGIIGAIGPIRRGEIKVRNAESQIDQDFDTIMIGHWHQEIVLPGLIVNPTLKGYDEFARSVLRAPYGRASQLLWFTHPEHGITSRWTIYLQGRERVKPAKVLEWME